LLLLLAFGVLFGLKGNAAGVGVFERIQRVHLHEVQPGIGPPRDAEGPRQRLFGERRSIQGDQHGDVNL
jgi:hypothetical protein